MEAELDGRQAPGAEGRAKKSGKSAKRGKSDAKYAAI